MLGAATKFLRQIVPPVIATLVAAVLIAGFNRAFSTHLTQPRMGGLNTEASARPPAKERTMEVATAVPATPILIEETAPVREWEKSYEREAAKDHGATKAAEATPAKGAEPAAPPAAQPTQPSGLALARTALRRIEPAPAEPHQAEQRPVQVAAVPAPAPAVAPAPVSIVVAAPPAPPVTQAPPPVITAEPPMVTVPDRPRRQPDIVQFEEPPAPPQPQGPIGMIVNTLKPSSLFARAREFGEKIEAAGNDILPNIRQQ